MPRADTKSKEKIAETAMKLFAARGFDNVAVNDICAAVGIPRSSFYLAFADKADILAYELQSVKDNFAENM